MSSESAKNKILSELKKWEVLSQKFRTSAHISYGKVRSYMAVFESSATRSDVIKLQSSIEKSITKISRNCNCGLENLTFDWDEKVVFEKKFKINNLVFYILWFTLFFNFTLINIYPVQIVKTWKILVENHLKSQKNESVPTKS